MNPFCRNLFAYLLAIFARAVLRKYKPTVIMVTGSVGKTSTRDAIAAALSQKTFVRASIKSYNNEFGVPMTVLGVVSPARSILGWLHVFGEAIALIIFPNLYPRVLVLEVGADRPGDLARVLRIATPDAVTVTRLPDIPVHVEAYATPAAVREEEFQPAYALPPGAPLILSCDDDYALKLAAPLSVRKLSFGFTGESDVKSSETQHAMENGHPTGMEADVTIGGKAHRLVVKGAVGAPQLLAPAAALATAIGLGTKVEDALKGLETYVPPPGRGRLLRGKEGTILIDDTYNASPAAVEEALASLALVHKKIPNTRRIAIIGDMLELGRYSKDEHEKIGKLARDRADHLITVGPRARAIARAALEAGMHENDVHSFGTSTEAAPHVAALVAKGDIVLVKGSQSIRTEKIVEALLLDPADQSLLVRQDREWKRR
jgi:UDP-N-acetylmuramoyl-tripeptide--D-alanyl-D-alanine ligase